MHENNQYHRDHHLHHHDATATTSLSHPNDGRHFGTYRKRHRHVGTIIIIIYIPYIYFPIIPGLSMFEMVMFDDVASACGWSYFGERFDGSMGWTLIEDALVMTSYRTDTVCASATSIGYRYECILGGPIDVNFIWVMGR